MKINNPVALKKYNIAAVNPKIIKYLGSCLSLILKKTSKNILKNA